jgi:hypothetical protein
LAARRSLTEQQSRRLSALRTEFDVLEGSTRAHHRRCREARVDPMDGVTPLIVERAETIDLDG